MFVPSPTHCLRIAHSISLTTQPGDLLLVPLANCAREGTGQSDNISAPDSFMWAFETRVLIICARYACLEITIKLFLSMLVIGDSKMKKLGYALIVMGVLCGYGFRPSMIGVGVIPVFMGVLLVAQGRMKQY